ncbi:MAG: alpha-hydroxy-acid oxidizing protein [Rhodospirillaceae bacterium]|nr:MAG: alpha-hydroxy-acid oxidizing protein [Rhodospirillaceae bacterium]
MSINRCYNVADFRRLAQRKLPAPMFHYIDGGADDEITMRRNTSAFDELELMPKVLVDVSKVDTRTKVLGTTLEWPVFLSPTGASRMFHHHKEIGVARAAAKSGTLYSLSTVGTTTIEDVAKASSGPKMFQLYVYKDRGLTAEFIARCKAANYTALCLTADTPKPGWRERDYVHGMTMPPKFGLRNLMSFVRALGWSMNYIRDPEFSFANLAHRVPARDVMALLTYMNGQFDLSVNWKDFEWLRKQWDGPLLVKGLLSVEDAKRARAAGASGVMISNHGGRQLEGIPASVDCIAPIRDAVGDSLELICDGGIRRGTHVLKALALGANACSIGRPYLYGLAAGGQAGVERLLALLRAEVERGMCLMGATKISDIDLSFLARRGRALSDPGRQPLL